MRDRRPVRLIQPSDLGYPPLDRAPMLRKVRTTEILVSSGLDTLVQAQALTDDPETLDALRRTQADLTGTLGRLRAMAASR